MQLAGSVVQLVTPLAGRNCRRFELECRVHHRHREVFGNALFRRLQNFDGVQIGEAAVVDHQMRRQNRQPGRDRGGVQIVHINNVVNTCLLYTSDAADE